MAEKIGSINQNELIGRSGARDGFSFGQLASKEAAHAPSGDVQNAVGSIALDRVQGHRSGSKIHLLSVVQR